MKYCYNAGVKYPFMHFAFRRTGGNLKPKNKVAKRKIFIQRVSTPLNAVVTPFDPSTLRLRSGQARSGQARSEQARSGPKKESRGLASPKLREGAAGHFLLNM